MRRAAVAVLEFMKKPKIPPTDWCKFETIAFAVVFWSSESGWLTMTQPDSPAEAHQSYEACDSTRKMLLNFGYIVRQTENAFTS